MRQNADLSPPFKVCEVKDCPGYGTPHPPLPEPITHEEAIIAAALAWYDAREPSLDPEGAMHTSDMLRVVIERSGLRDRDSQPRHDASTDGPLGPHGIRKGGEHDG